MSRQQPSGGGGLQIKTVLLASLAAMTAALVVPMIWRPGTLIATGLTPVIVLLTQELLKRPVDAVTAVSKKVMPGSPEALAAAAAAAAEQEPLTPEDRFGLQAELLRQDRGETRRRRLRVAVVTGLVGAAIAVVALTTTELTLFGKGIGSDDGGTTFFSGSSRNKSDKQSTTTTEQETTPEATTTPDDEAEREETPTPTPTASPTPTPTPTPTPAPGVAPTATAPAPAATPAP